MIVANSGIGPCAASAAAAGVVADAAGTATAEPAADAAGAATGVWANTVKESADISAATHGENLVSGFMFSLYGLDVAADK